MLTAILAIVVSVLFQGCISPPSPWESKYYNVETNYVDVVVTRTNIVPITNVFNVVITNTENFVITNETKIVSYTTNIYNLTNVVPISYQFSPSTNATEIAKTAGDVSNLVAPGTGGLVTAIVGGLFGIWGTMRSRKYQNTAGVLAQGIEVYGEVVKTLKGINGKDLDAEVKSWLQQNQAETGVIESVLVLLKNTVDNPQAKEVASQIQKFLEQRKTKVEA